MNTKNILITIVIAVIVGCAAFYGGIKYQQNQRPTFTVGSNSRLGSGTGGRGNGQVIQRFGGPNGERPVNGEIISQDDKSITVKMMDGSSKIVILSDTTAINKSAAGTKTDLTSGTRVLVVGKTNSDGSVTAQNIQLNPQIRMFGNGASPSPTAK